MKPTALAVLLIALAAIGDDAVDTKAAREKRKKSTTKVITNADVKKSKGKIVETNAPATPVEPGPAPVTLEQHAATRRAQADTAAKVAAAEKVVAELEQELAAVEQQYYDENDLDRRDTEIVKRFADVKTKLEKARDDLAKLNGA